MSSHTDGQSGTGPEPASATFDTGADEPSTDGVADTVSGLVATVKPRLRGWLHLGMFRWPCSVAWC